MEAETRYHPSAEQLALGSTMDESLSALLPLSRLHASFQEDAKTWTSLEEIGVFGIGVSEELGGSGLGAAEEALIVMGLGRRLASPGVLATIGAAHAQAQRGRGGIPRKAHCRCVSARRIGSSSSMSPGRLSCCCETAAVPRCMIAYLRLEAGR